MESILPDDPGTTPHRGRLNRAIKESLRDLGAQLSLLNHSVGTRLDLKATDLECLDLITRYGPLSPSALARRAGLHPATLTGILDRLERGGWIERGRDPVRPPRRRHPGGPWPRSGGPAPLPGRLRHEHCDGPDLRRV